MIMILQKDCRFLRSFYDPITTFGSLIVVLEVIIASLGVNYMYDNYIDVNQHFHQGFTCYK